MPNFTNKLLKYHRFRGPRSHTNEKKKNYTIVRITRYTYKSCIVYQDNFQRINPWLLKICFTCGYTLAGTGSSRPSLSLPSPPPAHPILAISLLATPRVWDSHSPSCVLAGFITTGAKVSSDSDKSCLGFISFSSSKRICHIYF